MGHLPKDYVSVSDRIDQFHEKYPNGQIETTPTFNGEIVYFTVRVTTDISNPRVFTGSSFGELSKEKAFEKLETVAVGRALAFAGFETQSGIASKEEMDRHSNGNNSASKDAPPANKNSSSDTAEQITQKQIGFIMGICKEHGVTEEDLKAYIEKKYSAKSRNDLTRVQASELITDLQSSNCSIYHKPENNDNPPPAGSDLPF